MYDFPSITQQLTRAASHRIRVKMSSPMTLMSQHWPYSLKLCLCSQPALCLRASWAPAFAVWQLFKVAAAISCLYKVWGLQNGRQPPELPLSQPTSVFLPQRDRLSIWFPWTRRYFSSKNNYFCFLKQGLTIQLRQIWIFVKSFYLKIIILHYFSPSLYFLQPCLCTSHMSLKFMVAFFLTVYIMYIFIHTFITKYINTASLVYIICMCMISGIIIWY